MFRCSRQEVAWVSQLCLSVVFLLIRVFIHVLWDRLQGIDIRLVTVFVLPAQLSFISVYTRSDPKVMRTIFFAQRRRARKGKWGLRRVEGEPRYTV